MNPRLINLKIVEDDLSKIAIMEADDQIPFIPMRALVAFDFKKQHELAFPYMRKSKATKEGHQLIIALKGECIISTSYHSRGVFNQTAFRLTDPSRGVYLPPIVYRSLTVDISDAILLILCSHLHFEDDHIRDYTEFVLLSREENK